MNEKTEQKQDEAKPEGANATEQINAVSGCLMHLREDYLNDSYLKGINEQIGIILSNRSVYIVNGEIIRRNTNAESNVIRSLEFYRDEYTKLKYKALNCR